MFNEPPYDWQPYFKTLENTETFSVNGYVRRVVGLLIEATGPRSPVGGVCNIFPRLSDGAEGEPVTAEVVGFNDDAVHLMPLDRKSVV